MTRFGTYPTGGASGLAGVLPCLLGACNKQMPGHGQASSPNQQ